MGKDNIPCSVIPQGLVETLRQARSVLVLTGAGISAESGLPTYRNAETGLWSNVHVEDLATVTGFRRNPPLVWNWYAERRVPALQALPNAGHLALAEMERRVPTFVLITQNIDGLHQRAGSLRVIELHGSLGRVKCLGYQHVFEGWPATGEDVPPRCPQCRSRLRPDVVWFGESLPQEAWSQAKQAAKRCDVFFSIGTSGMVEPAAGLLQTAERAGATIIVNNLEVEPLTSPHRYQLNEQAGELLPWLVQAVWPDSSPMVTV
ncbi:MAG: NAD-dependent deacylase [Ktedonobacteraceae bacterium]|nr:NAD-dependent deacylase [Ktedonobacteraceae bacterium]MBO0795632.1 NAD-dependent deacylase [Ktedonobacteraceae bacterium]